MNPDAVDQIGGSEHRVAWNALPFTERRGGPARDPVAPSGPVLIERDDLAGEGKMKSGHSVRSIPQTDSNTSRMRGGTVEGKMHDHR